MRVGRTARVVEGAMVALTGPRGMAVSSFKVLSRLMCLAAIAEADGVACCRSSSSEMSCPTPGTDVILRAPI